MNNALNAVTMTTMEIAAMTGKRHDNVLRDADRIIDQVGALKTEATYTTAQKKTMRMLILNKHMVFTIITGYDSGLRYTVLGRWIELEQIANPAFASQAITDTLNDLQSRVDIMAPAYAEHTRKGTVGRGYLWDEACRMADLPAEWTRRFMIAKGLFRQAAGSFDDRAGLPRPYVPRSSGFTKGLFKKTVHTVRHGGTPFKVTTKGLEYLQGRAVEITAWIAEQKQVKAVVDADGYVLDIKGEGSESMTVQDLPKETQ